MKVGDNILVYGTLRRNASNGVMMEGKSKFIRKTRINGLMYNLGWFPGLKVERGDDFISEGPTVEGDMFTITDERLPDRLDSYEGYPSLYSRRQVTTECGERVWVYTYNKDVSADRLIPEGIWKGKE